MIRHYEAIGLIRAPLRTESNYRGYSKDDVHVLRFIKRARTLGFSIDKVAMLLGLWQDRSRASADVKELALCHVAELEEKILELQDLVSTLRHLLTAAQAITGRTVRSSTASRRTLCLRAHPRVR